MAKKVLALGKNGQLVLRSADGSTQPIPKALGGCALLLIDCSSSMSGSKISEAKQGAVSFAEEAARKGYAVGLVSFASYARLISQPASHAGLAAAVAALHADGSTNMADAINLAIETVGDRGSRAIVLVTDGKPDSPEATIEAATRAKRLGIDIITIGVGGGDAEFLRLLSTRPDLATYVSIKELRSGITDAARMLSGVPTKWK